MLISITLATSLFGFTGMILGVPVFAVIYLLISDAVSSALRRKQRTTVTADYHDIQSVADLEKQEAETETPPEPAGKTT